MTATAPVHRLLPKVMAKKKAAPKTVQPKAKAVRKSKSTPKAGEMPATKRDDTVAGKLRRLIDNRSAGRSDADIAKAAGMHQQALSRLLKGGVKNPRLDTLRAVLDVLDADLCDFERA